ncbi:hypothetical protein [Metapseudomonas otitidis]|uniref:hypothetical protein n=1 Tax=Metapseudomonas otitidis TaxID=319939 RepID=UPI002449E940|nr:hypothetical protein [Pseudomonas otitidis]MDG9779805.1 hypothetical protein [Pseudomonas otitidis]
MDTKAALQGYSITSGTVRYSDLAYLVTTHDQAMAEGHTGSLLCTLDRGTWGAGAVDWLACSGTVCHTPAERYLVLGTDGSVRASGGGSVKEESPIGSCGVDPKKRGPLREIRAVAKGRAYAVGTCRQAYVRINESQWRCIDQSAQGGDVDITDTSFESIDGFDEQEIYTVGWEGEIWTYDGATFPQLTSPTNLALYKVRCAPDGYVYACGQLGTPAARPRRPVGSDRARQHHRRPLGHGNLQRRGLRVIHPLRLPPGGRQAEGCRFRR